MIKRYTKDINTDIFLNAADALNLKYEIIEKDRAYAKIYDMANELRVLESALSLNSIVSYRLARNKYKASKLLAQYEIPVPESELFRSESRFSNDLDKNKVFEYAKSKFPIVLKPVDRSLGLGVYTNITSDEQLSFALDELVKLNVKSIMVEKFVNGTDYRVLTYKDKVIDVVKRIPANVTGNGTATIQELISEKNKVRESDEMPIISIDSKVEFTLKKKELTLSSIPQNGENIILKDTCNMASGGETQKIEVESIHPENLIMFGKVADAAGLTVAGIDVIAEDISKHYKESSLAINEINASPFIDVHYFANNKKDIFAAVEILKLFFKIK